MIKFSILVFLSLAFSVWFLSAKFQISVFYVLKIDQLWDKKTKQFQIIYVYRWIDIDHLQFNWNYSTYYVSYENGEEFCYSKMLIDGPYLVLLYTIWTPIYTTGTHTRTNAMFHFAIRTEYTVHMVCMLCLSQVKNNEQTKQNKTSGCYLPKT